MLFQDHHGMSGRAALHIKHRLPRHIASTKSCAPPQARTLQMSRWEMSSSRRQSKKTERAARACVHVDQSPTPSSVQTAKLSSYPAALKAVFGSLKRTRKRASRKHLQAFVTHLLWCPFPSGLEKAHLTCLERVKGDSGHYATRWKDPCGSRW